jgi:SPP1 gp7 family putative phage head morphogenesis protein
MSWQKQFDGTAERLAARHADKINDAMADGINIAQVVRAWLETQPSVNTTREQAAVWVHHNVIPNTEPLEEALKDIYVEGYALGQAFAATAYARAKLSIKKAAPTGPELRAAFETDWNNWQAGSEAQALKTEKPGALQYLFDQAAISEKTKIWKNSMDRLGVVMADTARKGLGVSTTQQAIIEAQIGWGFDHALKDPYKAMRIARTEINRAQSLATMDTYREYGLEQVEWLASDDDTCDICPDNMALGPQPIGFEWDSIEGGTTEPPAHPNCRCTLMPALDNEPTGDEAPVEGESDQVELPADVEAADLTAVAVDLPEAEQPSTDGTIVDQQPSTELDIGAAAEVSMKDIIGTDRKAEDIEADLSKAYGAWKGPQGETIETSVKSVSQQIQDGKLVNNQVKVMGIIKNAEGVEVGTFSRTFLRDVDTGKLTADHDRFVVGTKFQGSGIGRSFSDFSEAWYKEAGIREIRLDAGLQSGGYTWAKAGYDWNTKGDISSIQDHIEDKARRIERTIKSIETDLAMGNTPYDLDQEFIDGFGGLEQAREWADKLNVVSELMVEADIPAGPERDKAFAALPKPFELANLDGPKIDDQSFGRWLLAGSNWNGVKKID